MCPSAPEVGGPGALRSFHPLVMSSLERLCLRAWGRGARMHYPGGCPHAEARAVFEYKSRNERYPLYRSVYKSIKNLNSCKQDQVSSFP